MMMAQILDFILCIWAFFKPIKSVKYSMNQTTRCDTNGFTLDYYEDEIGVPFINENNTYNNNIVNSFGSHPNCPCCGKVIHFNNQTTYACNGREFCSSNCCKKFSREDLIHNNGFYNSPVVEAIANRRVIHYI